MGGQPDKYITFKRNDLRAVLDQLAYRDIQELEVADAVVIRRRDVFAGPALAAYAHSIAIAAMVAKGSDPVLYDQLIVVSDYLHEQAELASEEGGKFPDV